jgi:uncharacterized Rossmann fold enzyme
MATREEARRVINVVSVNVGPKYSMDRVTVLHDMVARNLSNQKQRHWCLTDRPDELPEGIEAIPAFGGLPGWWNKVALFSPAMPWSEGDEILYMDLDVCVTGRLEELPHGIIKDWHWPGYNSSVMRWAHGDHSQIWTAFDPEVIDKPSEALAGVLPKGQVNGGDQEWIGQVSSWDLFPREWFISYRNAVAWPPDGSKAIIFHGEPKPWEVEQGWVPGVYRVGGYTSVPVLKGMNVSHEFAYANVKANSERDLPWFTGHEKQKGACVIVGGGPSMRDCLDAIKAHRRRGAKIVTVNNALTYLHDRGITPDVHVMLDAREENVSMVQNAPKNVRYMLASQVHPCVFDALKDHNVSVWHNGMGSGEELGEILKPWWDSKPICLVPGGGTVGLRALNLAWLSGYRKIHLYGFDSCYHEGQHHAYSQSLNDGEPVQEVVLADKRYTAARWMIRQAAEFQDAYRHLTAEGVKVMVHGRGLIPDMWKLLCKQ